MTRAQLEHVIGAAGTIADVEDIVVIGSQAVLGEFPDAPAELLLSNETDVFPREHGVDETTAILPQGWRDRLILVSGEKVHDLAIAKYAAGRKRPGFHKSVGASFDGPARGAGTTSGVYFARSSNSRHRMAEDSRGFWRFDWRRAGLRVPRRPGACPTYSESSLAMISFIISEVPAPMVYRRRSRQ